MTRKRLILIIIPIAALALGVILILSRVQPSAPRVEDTIPTLPGPTPAALTARLNEIQGIVTARRAGQAQFDPVSPGLVLNVSSAVKTGDQSKVRLDLSNQSIVRLGGNTLFVFNGEVKTNDGYHYLINLGIGEVWIILRGGQLEVQTPSGLAAVRGSFLHVSYSPLDKTTKVTCMEGSCNLKNASGQVDLIAGQTAIVFNAGVPPAAGRMDSQDITSWLVNNPEATLVIPQLQATSAALPIETPGASGTPPPTQAATELAIFEATLAATYETPVLPTLLATGTRVAITPSSAPSASPAATLGLTTTAQATGTQGVIYWTAVPATPKPMSAPQSTATPSATALPVPVTGCVGVSEIPVLECNALAALYNALNGPSWIYRAGWMVTTTPCSWYGITCKAGHVVAISLTPDHPTGTLPSLKDLTHLSFLDLDGNMISGRTLR